jgi:hypothetical protein
MSCRGREAELRPGAELVWHKHVQSPRGCNSQDPAWRVELLRLQEVQNHLKGCISKDSRSIVWGGARGSAFLISSQQVFRPRAF